MFKGFILSQFVAQNYKPPARPMSHWRKNMSQIWKKSGKKLLSSLTP